MSTRPLEHLVFLSVVASGDPDSEEGGKIVLLAWQTLSLTKNKVLQSDMTFVKPSGMPRKGSLPVGISEDSLHSAPDLAAALKQFHSSLTKLAGSTFSLMTLGPLPLRHYLHPEAHKHNLTLQRYLCHYLDLTKEFAKTFPSTEAPASLDVMMENLEIEPSTETNLGLNEVANMCCVAQKLIERGHSFQCAEVIRSKTDFTVTPDSSQVLENCVIRLRGLPFQNSVQDVAGFLTGLNIIPGGIFLGINAVGRRTGEAVVALESPEQAELGLKRHKHFLDKRYVEVYEATVDDFLQQAGVGGGASSGGGSGGSKDTVYVVRMQGLPYRATETEIVDFFGSSAPVKSEEDGILIVRYPDGRASGDAFAVFEEEGHLEEAMKLNRSTLGTRYVLIYKSSVKELRLVLARSASAQKQQQFSDLLGLSVESSSEMQELRGREKKFVKLRGLPWSCKPDDVVRFFGSLKDEIAPHGVHMVLNAVNRPTGECYVQLKSVDGANRAAVDLHKQYIDDRYIEVFQCSGDEVAKAIYEHGTGGGSGGGGGGGGRGYSSYRGGGGGGGRRRRHSSGTSVKCRGLPYSAREEELVEFFSEYDVGYDDVEIIFNNEGRAAGIAYVTFASRSLAQRAVKEKDGQHIGSRYVDLSLS